ncbi:hypothetical protein LVJ83_12170 [Uruburuella testudinis]|uniref:Uncharacterized protein n=1 Tax=Uruburuella testudinis TaxID=1282863 RepID=A0ABY4DSJ9_9NEIS|nr:hypothetical protein [Uruburuella testudinis]UOO81660.1 hypothetical protein LVJ83_12170 [Uruburuella testudinis]
MLYCAFRHHFRRPDRYSSLTACALSLTLSRGRGNSVAVVFTVTRFLPLCVFAVVRLGRRLFFRQPYRFSNLTPSPVGEGWGEGGKPQVCFIVHSVIISDGLTVIQALRLVPSP